MRDGDAGTRRWRDTEIYFMCCQILEKRYKLRSRKLVAKVSRGEVQLI
ncbi:hypothetical protein [Calothrix sp. UHCC 0171]|nr:hypothetical protein [Calothrix sp. UHCC 0171]MEA5570463.1 hypothetical protein [Calothrix sp. UHCC 0171]